SGLSVSTVGRTIRAGRGAGNPGQDPSFVHIALNSERSETDPEERVPGTPVCEWTGKTGHIDWPGEGRAGGGYSEAEGRITIAKAGEAIPRPRKAITHPGSAEAHPRKAIAHPGSAEAHPRKAIAHPGSAEAHSWVAVAHPRITTAPAIAGV